MTDTPQEVTISPARKAFLSGASIVWIIPLLALLVALFVAWQSYNERGPLIAVEFEQGTGIAAGETELKYRDITVGKVEKVGFTEGLGKVVAEIRLDKDVAPYVDNGSVFWVVQPEVSAQGITGLSTVLSGVFIEGSWDDQIGPPAERFSGTSEAPLIQSGGTGLEIAFRTTANGQLTDNAPILFKGIEVGKIGRAKIDPRDGTAFVEALIYDEHRVLVNSSTRFWDASGFSVNIGPAGAEINFSSLATLVGGGVTFNTFVSGGGRVSDGTVFEIFPDEETARSSVFNASEVEPLKVSAIFDDNISGLVVGADVELNGLTIGKVDTLSGLVDQEQFGDNRVRLNVILSIQPARLGLPGDVTAENALRFLQERVRAGLRARLISGSLLTGGLKVELTMVEDAAEAPMNTSPNGLPIMPTTESEVSDTAATVEGVFNRINNLPIEELLNSAISIMNSADVLISSEDLRETPSDVRALLAEIAGLVTSDDVQNIPVTINATLSKIEALVGELEEQQLATRLVSAVETVTETAGSVATSFEGVPELLTSLTAVADKADALEIEALITEVTALVDSAETLLAAEATQEIPAAVNEAIDQVNATLAELRAAGAVNAINETLASVRLAATNVATSTEELPGITELLGQVLDEAAATTANINTAVEGVPQIIEQIQSIAAKADSLEIEQLVQELTNLTSSADTLISSEDFNNLPRALKRALDEVNFTLQALREGGTVENVNQTLASARNAADNVATTANGLPAVLGRLNRVLAQAGTTLQGFDRGDELTRSVQGTLRDIQKAADALASLARTIERNPNSLLLGR